MYFGVPTCGEQRQVVSYGNLAHTGPYATRADLKYSLINAAAVSKVDASAVRALVRAKKLASTQPLARRLSLKYNEAVTEVKADTEVQCCLLGV